MNATVEDLSPTIVPKSDQLNADQLLGGPMTITVSGVKIGSTDEQPISVHYQNDDGRPFKPCKTMRKVLVLAWGADGRKWAGRSMTLYTDPSVRFGKDEVGGIRISHLTDIPSDIAVNLNATKGKKKLYEIKRMAAPSPSITGQLADLAASPTLESLQDNYKAAFRAAKSQAERDQLTAEKDKRKGELQAASAPPAGKTYAHLAEDIQKATDSESAALE